MDVRNAASAAYKDLDEGSLRPANKHSHEEPSMKSAFQMSTMLAVAVATLVALPALVGQPSVAQGSIAVTGSDLNDSRSSAVGGGIIATDGWGNGGFEISWAIGPSGDANFPWSYKYTITGAGGGNLSKGLSHWLLQVSDNATIDDFDSFSSGPASGDPQTYSPSDPGNSNPNLPSDIFGLKFDGGGSRTFTTSFLSTKEPVWGDFYAKDGVQNPGHIDVTAYNAGFGTDPVGPDFTNWIARPDGSTTPGPTPDAPEPISLLVWGGLAAVGAVMAYRRRGGNQLK